MSEGQQDYSDIVGKPPAVKRMGRPSSYTPEVAAEICRQLACGVPLAKICAQDGMPHYTTVRRWEADHPDFRVNSARAKQDGTHHLADSALMIADEPLPKDPEAARTELAKRRLQIDTRMRLIGKWNSRAYGDKVLLGEDADNPLQKPEATIDVFKLAEQLREAKRLSSIEPIELKALPKGDK